MLHRSITIISLKHVALPHSTGISSKDVLTESGLLVSVLHYNSVSRLECLQIRSYGSTRGVSKLFLLTSPYSALKKVGG